MTPSGTYDKWRNSTHFILEPFGNESRTNAHTKKNRLYTLTLKSVIKLAKVSHKNFPQ